MAVGRASGFQLRRGSRFWRPGDLAVVVVGEVGYVAGAGRGDSGLYWSGGLFAGLDAVEEILHVGDGAVLEAVGAKDRVALGRGAFAMDGESAAINFQGGFGAAEFEAAVVDGGGHGALVDDIEAGIAQRGLKSVRAIPLRKDMFIGEDLGVAGLVGLHGPVDDVNPMGEEIGHGATARVPEPAPEIESFCAERLVGSAALPLLPIEGLHVDRLERLRCVGEIVLPPIGADLRNAAEAAALNEIDGVAKVAPTALLHPALQDLFAGADRAGEGGAFLQGVGDWLFEIDVFAGRDGVDSHADVPVVGRGDEDGVELLVENFAIIDVGGGGETVGAQFYGVATGTVDVTDGYDLVVGDFVGGVQQVVHAAASADNADAKSVVCAEDSGGGESGEATGDDKSATIELV